METWSSHSLHGAGGRVLATINDMASAAPVVMGYFMSKTQMVNKGIFL